MSGIVKHHQHQSSRFFNINRFFDCNIDIVYLIPCIDLCTNQHWLWVAYGHFTHDTESPWPLHFKHSHWWKRRSRSKFDPRYPWGTNEVCECKMDVKSTWIPIWHQLDHVSWSLGMFFFNHLLEVGLTQHRETMAFRTLTTVDLFYFIMVENRHE